MTCPLDFFFCPVDLSWFSQYTDALTILNEISSELITRTAGPSKGLAPLDLQTEPEIARLIDLVAPR